MPPEAVIATDGRAVSAKTNSSLAKNSSRGDGRSLGVGVRVMVTEPPSLLGLEAVSHRRSMAKRSSASNHRSRPTVSVCIKRRTRQ